MPVGMCDALALRSRPIPMIEMFTSWLADRHRSLTDPIRTGRHESDAAHAAHARVIYKLDLLSCVRACASSCMCLKVHMYTNIFIDITRMLLSASILQACVH